MKNYIRVAECSDQDKNYGILIVPSQVLQDEVQQKIYEIKSKFNDEGFDDWQINDVFEQFPDEWDWEFIRGDEVVEI